MLFSARVQDATRPRAELSSPDYTIDFRFRCEPPFARIADNGHR